mgnify:CR=1 FL=1
MFRLLDRGSCSRQQPRTHQQPPQRVLIVQALRTGARQRLAHFQLTGRANYADAGAGVDLPLLDAPELLEQPDGAARSAAWFWQSRGLNALADDRSDDDDDADFVTITRLINGGTVGIEERRRYWAQARTALGPA